MRKKLPLERTEIKINNFCGSERQSLFLVYACTLCMYLSEWVSECVVCLHILERECGVRVYFLQGILRGALNTSPNQCSHKMYRYRYREKTARHQPTSFTQTCTHTHRSVQRNSIESMSVIFILSQLKMSLILNKIHHMITTVLVLSQTFASFSIINPSVLPSKKYNATLCAERCMCERVCTCKANIKCRHSDRCNEGE